MRGRNAQSKLRRQIREENSESRGKTGKRRTVSIFLVLSTPKTRRRIQTKAARERSAVGFIAQSICETLWPTRCALCDTPGKLLCPRCARSLEFIDYYRACPRCGSPWGSLQCDRCNPVTERELADVSPCVSCFRYEGGAALLVKTYKDKGEQRLADVLARFLADVVDPAWKEWAQAVSYIPATTKARRRRGFDHMALVAQSFSRMTGLPCTQTLEECKAADQRTLSRQERIANMQGRFQAIEALGLNRVLLLDDVITTGATLSSAQCALDRSRCSTRIATIARA